LHAAFFSSQNQDSILVWRSSSERLQPSFIRNSSQSVHVKEIQRCHIHQRNGLCGINMENWYKMHKWLCRSFLLALLIQDTSRLSKCCILYSLTRPIYELISAMMMLFWRGTLKLPIPVSKSGCGLPTLCAHTYSLRPHLLYARSYT
jgi:hypothetical protein